MSLDLIHADCIQYLTENPQEGRFDMVVADPPYSSGGAMRSDRAQNTTTKYVNSDSGNQALGDFLGDNKDQRSYAYWCHIWMSLALRSLKPGGLFLVFTDWRQLPITSDAFQAAGVVWRGVVPWVKGYGRPVANRYSNTSEFVLVGTKGPRDSRAGQPNALYAEGFFQYRTTRDRIHITEKPVALYSHLFKVLHEGSHVLDPFLGSGTSALAAHDSGLNFTGLELSPGILQRAQARIASHVGAFQPANE